MNLLDNDETLFYRLIMSDPARFLPIVYDPTIAEACLKFGHIFRRPRGMYLSITRKGRVKEILQNWPVKDVRFICVTNGGRILGLGDLGANGMGIPIGKLQPISDGRRPSSGTPPHVSDAGTNNEALLHDPLYVGLRRPRPSTEELSTLLLTSSWTRCKKSFLFAAFILRTGQAAMPSACSPRYRDRVCCYNDDIQGTAGIALAGLVNALKVTGGKLKDQRILFLGVSVLPALE